MSRKPTWVELMESSIEEMKKEYDERFKNLEVKLTKSIANIELELIELMFASTPAKDLQTFKDAVKFLKEEYLDKWKEIGIAICKKGKTLNDMIALAKIYGINDFEEVIKTLVSNFDVDFIKDTMTIERVTEEYRTEGAKIFKELAK
jgi:DNA-binding ferritin-like protein (Dps family)